MSLNAPSGSSPLKATSTHPAGSFSETKGTKSSAGAKPSEAIARLGDWVGCATRKEAPMPVSKTNYDTTSAATILQGFGIDATPANMKKAAALAPKLDNFAFVDSGEFTVGARL